MTLPPRRRSKFLTDKDYENLIGWDSDNRSSQEILIRQGDKYDGIIEVDQNAVDSTLDPYKDKNDIHMTIPCLGDPEYGELIMRVVDHGQKGLLKEYARIWDFLNAKKSVSFKGEMDIGQNGQGMVQYQKLSITQRVTTRTNESLYRFYIVPSEDTRSRISYTQPEDHPITPEWEEKWGLYHAGTMVEWFDAYEGAKDIDPNKAYRVVRETFGWRLMVAPNTRIFINGNQVELPDYLAKVDPEKDLDNYMMGTRTVNRDNIPTKVNPKITGFLVEDKKKGRGVIVVHAKGYKVCEMSSGADKAGTFYMNCDQLSYVMTANRKGFNDDEFIEDLKEKCRWIMRDLPDIKDDTQSSERKESKSVQEILSKGLGKYLERYMKHLHLKSFQKIKTERMIDPDGDDAAGYPTYEKKDKGPIPMCELCNHKKARSKSMRKRCECECHIPREKGPNKKTSTVGLDELHAGKVETSEEKENKKGFDTHFVEVGPFIEVFPETRHINVNKLDKLYTFCVKKVPSAKLSAQRMSPYMAEVAMFLEQPNAYHELSREDYIEKLHEYTIDILESEGERL